MAKTISILPKEQWASAICNRCVSPGQCCNGFSLSNEHGELTYWDQPLHDRLCAMHNDNMKHKEEIHED